MTDRGNQPTLFGGQAACSLPELADRINAGHSACLASAGDAIARAIEVGRLLVEARDQVRHGEWAGWVEVNCSFGTRQAQNYMRAYRNRDEIEAQLRSGASHLTSLRGALEALAPGEESGQTPADGGGRSRPYVPIRETEPERRHWLCEQWFDQRAKYTVMLDAAGWDAGAIADYLGRPAADIEAILDPRLPIRFDSERNGLWMFEKTATPEQIRALADFYGRSAQHLIESWLAEAYRSAERGCKLEGFGDAAPILQAGVRRHGRRRDAAGRDGTWLLRPFFGEPSIDIVLFWCTVYDACHAVRENVEKDKDRWSPSLATMFAALQDRGEDLDEEADRHAEA